MRLTDILGARVLDRDRVGLGHVHDVRMLQDGLRIGSLGAAPQVHLLIVGSPGIGVRLGFGRSEVRGPWIAAASFRHLHRDLLVVPWQAISLIEEGKITLSVSESDLPRGAHERPKGARVIDAGLELLDRQMTDRDGLMAGNVDDLELAWHDGGELPSVTAILAGPGALARRLGGRLGGAVAAVHDRLQDRDVEGPARIDFGVVTSIGSDVRLSVSREDLATMRVEAWVRDRLIVRIPGAR